MAMPMPMPHRLVERAVRRFEAQTSYPGALRSQVTRPAPSPRVITISRQLGSGGRRVAEALSERLGWTLWDREILDVLAAQSGRPLQARLLAALDEKARGHVHALIEGWLTGVDSYQYEYLLPRAILAIAQKNAIIIGRGAHLFLPESLRVRIVAPPAVRVENLITFDGLMASEARAHVARIDGERTAFLDALRGRLAQRGRVPIVEYDIVLNTGKVSVHDAAAIVADLARTVFRIEADRSASAGVVTDAPPEAVSHESMPSGKSTQ